jgi:hypothetical protein
MSNSMLIRSIVVDQRTQFRVDGLIPAVLEEYTEAVRSGVEFPAVVVFYDGQTYYLADGFHRLESHKLAGREEIEAVVHEGTLRDAQLYAMRANVAHGLRATRADKRSAVEAMLRDEEWRNWSDREIGRQCGVDGKTVAAVREQLGVPVPAKRTVKRGGKEVVYNTGNIGRTEGSSRPVQAVDLDDSDTKKAQERANNFGVSLEDALVWIKCEKQRKAVKDANAAENEAKKKKLLQKVGRKLQTVSESERSRAERGIQSLEKIAKELGFTVAAVAAAIRKRNEEAAKKKK